ncbi:hypothetical protein KJY78_00200 [Canibacter sp. lx-45]|uniref:LmeA family phospholipid-binding protein n=1 Tax=Canibacter zhuwentaonis TaxID=2837491 RepID=UPI001BDBEF83|nr:DUF2993 domain-containing protein [Canibacter zhuwentaonis]MBT1034780.1 hypothetical protein [Canibacter zhuwentaonis]
MADMLKTPAASHSSDSSAVAPVAGATAAGGAAATESGERALKPKKSLFKGRKSAIIGAVVVLLLVLVVVAEMLARAFVPKIAESALRRELGLAADHPLTVETRGVLLPQLISGHLQNVTVDLKDYNAAPGVTGSAIVKVRKVALNPQSAPLEGATAVVSMSNAQFQKVLQTVAPEYIDGAEVHNDAIVLQKNLEAFGQSVPAKVSVKVDAQNSKLLITPLTVSVAGITVSPQSVGEVVGGYVGGYAKLLTSPVEFCVADRLPAGVKLTGVQSQRGKISAVFDVDPEILMRDELQKPGSC